MVARPEMLGHFIFNSDYPVDKIVWLYEGQFTTSSDNLTNVNIPIESLLNTNETIFIKGAASVDNWATSIMIGTSHSIAGKNAGASMYWTNSSTNKLRLTFDFRSYGGRTAKYRLWGVARDDATPAVDYPKTSITSKSKLIFNTELNYPRLYKDGVAMSGETVYHNLGKIPYVDYWYVSKSTTSVTPATLARRWEYSPTGRFGDSLDSYPAVRATDKTLTFRKLVVNGDEQRDLYYYYRIYA